MSDKPPAGLMAALAVAPLCLVCVLGPAALVAAGGWFLAWLGGFGVPLIASVLAVRRLARLARPSASDCPEGEWPRDGTSAEGCPLTPYYSTGTNVQS